VEGSTRKAAAAAATEAEAEKRRSAADLEQRERRLVRLEREVAALPQQVRSPREAVTLLKDESLPLCGAASEDGSVEGDGRRALLSSSADPLRIPLHKLLQCVRSPSHALSLTLARRTKESSWFPSTGEGWVGSRRAMDEAFDNGAVAI